MGFRSIITAIFGNSVFTFYSRIEKETLPFNLVALLYSSLPLRDLPRIRVMSRIVTLCCAPLLFELRRAIALARPIAAPLSRRAFHHYRIKEVRNNSFNPRNNPTTQLGSNIRTFLYKSIKKCLQSLTTNTLRYLSTANLSHKHLLFLPSLSSTAYKHIFINATNRCRHTFRKSSNSMPHIHARFPP